MSVPTFGGGRNRSVEDDATGQDVAPVEQPAEDQPYEVKSNPADPRQAKTLFSGTFKDALRYIRDNFPRLHVEPGGGNPVPDALLHAPNGDVYAHLGEGAVGADDNGLAKQEGNEQ